MKITLEIRDKNFYFSRYFKNSSWNKIYLFFNGKVDCKLSFKISIYLKIIISVLKIIFRLNKILFITLQFLTLRQLNNI